MTIESGSFISGPYPGNGSQTEFDYDFKIYDASDLEVILTDSSGEDSIVSPSDYSITGVGLDNGGTISLNSAPASDEYITIRINPPDSQSVSLRNQSSYSPDVVERAIDRTVMLVKYIYTELARCVKVGVTDDPVTYLEDAQSAASAAAASASLASSSATAADNSAQDAAASATAAAASAGTVGNLYAVSHKTAAYTLVSGDKGTTFTNKGTSVSVGFRMPVWEEGFVATFVCVDSDGLTIRRSTSDSSTFRIGSQTAGANGYLSASLGASITLKGLNNGEWHCVAREGSWYVDEG